MEILILASGSKGNAISISVQDKIFLIDAGVSYLTLKNKLEAEKIEMTKIEKLLLTHEHQDHIKGLKTFLKNHPSVEVFLTKGTYNALPKDIRELMLKFKIIIAEQNFQIDGLNIFPFMLSHDAAEPVGFVIENDDKKMVIATDTGYIDECYFDQLRDANLYVLEANHEPEMLMKSPRPFHLKKRILSEKGHLSNQDASWLINEFIKNINEAVWVVAHISEDCNSVLSIEKSIVKLVEDPTKLIVKYSSQETLEKIKV